MKNLFLKGGRSGGVRSLGGDDDTLDGKCSVRPEMMEKNGAGQSWSGGSLDCVCATRRAE